MLSTLTTVQDPYHKLFSSNSTSGSWGSKVPTTTKPTGDGVIEVTANLMSVIFFGTDAADETFDARLWGWRKSGNLWVPKFILQVTATLGSTQGVSGEPITNSDFIADTLSAATSPTGDPNHTIISPENNLIAELNIDPRGCELLEMEVNIDTAASGNALATGY